MKLDVNNFSDQDKMSWKAAAEKALKGMSIDTLKWDVDTRIHIDPIYTKEEAEHSTSTLEIEKTNNDWWIGEPFDCSEPSVANSQLVAALEGGLNSPCLFGVQDYKIALDQVRLDFTFPVFKDCSTDGFLEWIGQQDYNLETLEGAFIIDYQSTDLLKKISNILPKFYHRVCHLELDAEDLGRSLGISISRLVESIIKDIEQGIDPRLIIDFELNDDFLQSIAVIRATKLILAQLARTFGWEQERFFLDAHIFSMAPDIQLCMIGATSQATAAISAGVDRMTISCDPIHVDLDESTRRRMCRNVHQVMKMESGMHEVVDPLGGSYLLEKLTSEIAQNAWTTFQGSLKRQRAEG